MKTNYNNGHVIDVAEMTVNEYEIAAKEWSEGSKNFEELLLYCLKNGISPNLVVLVIKKMIQHFYNLN